LIVSLDYHKGAGYIKADYSSFRFAVLSTFRNKQDDCAGDLHSERFASCDSSGMALALAVRFRDMLKIHQASRPLKAIMLTSERKVRDAVRIALYREDFH
jgi:hypothetical protein